MKPGQYGPSKVAMMFKNYPVGSDQSECQFESGSLPRLILAGIEEELCHVGHCCQMRFSLFLSCRFFPCVRKQKSLNNKGLEKRGKVDDGRSRKV